MHRKRSVAGIDDYVDFTAEWLFRIWEKETLYNKLISSCPISKGASKVKFKRRTLKVSKGARICWQGAIPPCNWIVEIRCISYVRFAFEIQWLPPLTSLQIGVKKTKDQSTSRDVLKLKIELEARKYEENLVISNRHSNITKSIRELWKLTPINYQRCAWLIDRRTLGQSLVIQMQV